MNYLNKKNYHVMAKYVAGTKSELQEIKRQNASLMRRKSWLSDNKRN